MIPQAPAASTTLFARLSLSARLCLLTRHSLSTSLSIGDALALGALSLGVFAPSAAGLQAPACDPDDAGLTLPDGFCAMVVADGLRSPRHIAVSESGDIFVAAEEAGVFGLRDADGDGVAEERVEVANTAGNGVALHGGYLYVAPDDRVVRYPIEEGSLVVSGEAETIVRDLPDSRSHAAKSIAIDSDANLYVNIGSPSNACQEQPRTAGSPGQDPCPELETRAGIWVFDADTPNQTQADGSRFATGLRNTVALALHPQTEQLWGAVHGRDQLAQLWGEEVPRFDAEYSAENPAEELVAIDEGDDFGWPYCYHSNAIDRKVLAPEYGGDGNRVGRCAAAEDPAVAFPGHWAPNGLVIYTADAFPEQYRGAFVAFHGSWNRAPLPQGGYNVAFAPFDGTEPTGEWEVFADGFAGGDESPGGADHRPTGLAVAPDGSLLVADDSGGTLFRIVYEGM